MVHVVSFRWDRTGRGCVRTRELELAAFFGTLEKWRETEGAELFFAQMMWRRRGPSALGALAPYGRIKALGALGVWGCGGGDDDPALFT